MDLYFFLRYSKNYDEECCFLKWFGFIKKCFVMVSSATIQFTNSAEITLWKAFRGCSSHWKLHPLKYEVKCEKHPAIFYSKRKWWKKVERKEGTTNNGVKFLKSCKWFISQMNFEDSSRILVGKCSHSTWSKLIARTGLL